MPKKFQHGDPQVFVVCDGVGGSNFGEVASELASTVFYSTMVERIKEVPTQFVKLVQQCVVKFKAQVEQYIVEHPEAHGTSTTLTLAVVIGEKAYIAWCGDSRVYQVRNGKVKFRSNDHSLVFDLISQGIITEEQAATHPQRNVITRSLNSHTKQTDVETAVLELHANDWLLLCTDGLLEQFKENKFDIHLKTYKSGLDYADYINKMCENRTSDNYSMYLLYCERDTIKKTLLLLLLLVLGLAVGLVGFEYFTKNASVVPPQTERSAPKSTTPLIHSNSPRTADTLKQELKGSKLNNLVK